MKTDKASRKKQAFQAFLIYTIPFLILMGLGLFLDNTPEKYFAVLGIMYGVFAVFTMTYVWGLIIIDKIVSSNFVPELFKGDLLTREEAEIYATDSATSYVELPDVEGN